MVVANRIAASAYLCQWNELVGENSAAPLYDA